MPPKSMPVANTQNCGAYQRSFGIRKKHLLNLWLLDEIRLTAA